MEKINNLETKDFCKFLAPAKINIFLKVLSRRSDNYHNIQSVFQLIDLFDELYFRPRQDTKIVLQDAGNIKNNLIMQAAKKILNNTSYGVDIILKKNIPIGAGLGGGSSNAALTLMALNKLFKLNLSQKELMGIALEIGADVPFFIYGKNAWAEGIGNIFTPIEIANNSYLLATTELNISTKKIFQAFKLTKESIPMKIATSLDDNLYHLSQNDLQTVCFDLYPEMRETYEWMSQFGQIKMTGSGSVLFCKLDENQKLALKTVHKPAKITLFMVRGLSIHPFYAID